MIYFNNKIANLQVNTKKNDSIDLEKIYNIPKVEWKDDGNVWLYADLAKSKQMFGKKIVGFYLAVRYISGVVVHWGDGTTSTNDNASTAYLTSYFEHVYDNSFADKAQIKLEVVSGFIKFTYGGEAFNDSSYAYSIYAIEIPPSKSPGTGGSGLTAGAGDITISNYPIRLFLQSSNDPYHAIVGSSNYPGYISIEFGGNVKFDSFMYGYDYIAPRFTAIYIDAIYELINKINSAHTWTSTTYMFDGSWFSKKFDFSQFDMSQTKSINRMFRNVRIDEIDASSWDVSQCYDFSHAFEGCQAKLIDVSGWNMSSAQTLANMFLNCTNLISLDISGWDISNATNITGLFSGCSKLYELHAINWDLSNIISLENIFNSCTSLVIFDISTWKNTSNITSMYRTFFMLQNINILDLSNFDTSNVTNMFQTFYGCKKLIDLDISSWNLLACTNITGMFQGCNGLVDLKCPTTPIGPKISFSLGDSKNLSHDSLVNVLQWIADLTGSSTQTLTLGETNLAKLSDDEKAIATAKNWTLA